MKKRTLTFILGPTASGKTGLALREAERTGAVILSCDSLCFYRGMDIGTAKPTRDERARVPHFGIDLSEPEEPYSVNRYIEYRDQVLKRLGREDRAVLVVGGSGFYLKSFFSAVTDSVEIAPEIGERVGHLAREAGLSGLLDLLRELNPGEGSFPGLDLKNPRRVEKAIIRCLASGLSYRDLRREFKAMEEPLQDWGKEVWLVDRPDGELRIRNRERVGQMLRYGLVEEVRALRARGFEKNPSACGAIGYREVLDYLDGRISREQLEEAIYIHTNQLMRKQRTWFRNQIPIDRRLSG